MPDFNEKILIVGGGSLIGKGLYGYFNHEGYEVIATSRKKETNHIYLDLNNVTNFVLPKKITIAYICAGITKKIDCEYKPVDSYNINVVNTVELIKDLINQEIHTVFLSSNEVFSGVAPFIIHDADKQPASKYGALKAETEDAIINIKRQNYSIVRITKVLDRNNRLITNWASELKKGGIVKAFQNVYISPISLKYATENLSKIGLERSSGLYHLSGAENTSYYSIAQTLAQYLNVPEEKVIPECIDNNMANTYASLDMSKELIKLSIKPQLISEVFNEIMQVNV